MRSSLRPNARIMRKRTIQDILNLIAQFQAQHAQKFPSVASPFIGVGDSWNAIDGALRRDAMVQCKQFVELKAALLQRGLTPSLARLNPAYLAPRTRKRQFSEILVMVKRSVKQHAQFPLRTSPFEVLGYHDTWTAIDSALIGGAIIACPLWRAHCSKMEQLGVTPSLASLHPDYRPVRRQPRSIASIMALIVNYMSKNAGKMPNQRASFPRDTSPDSWKAICQALRLGAVMPDADRGEFYARLDLSGQKPSLFTFIECYRSQLQAQYERAWCQPLESSQRLVSRPAPACIEKKPVQFAALISQLFCGSSVQSATADIAASGQ